MFEFLERKGQDMTAKERIVQYLDGHMAEFAACSDTIHELAEPSAEEYKSAEVLEDLLEAHGFRVERGLKDQPTAFRAVYGSGAVRIGYMCEYDGHPPAGGCALSEGQWRLWPRLRP